MKQELEFGIIGLGRMGGQLAAQALEKGCKVVGLDVSTVPEPLIKSGLKVAGKHADFAAMLKRPRIVFLFVPAGPIIDNIVESLGAVLEKEDIIIDGGNSYWGDSIRRYRRLAENNLKFIDLGTSGGIEGARKGACFMAGGEPAAVKSVEPILLKLAAPEGYVYAGPPGAGHFTKLVHNGIEFGMLQAIGEGVALLEEYRDELDVNAILNCWRHGSVIRSWLIDLMQAAYSKGGIEDIPTFIEDTGEVNWLVSDALRMEVPIPVISQSVMQLFTSRDERKYWARAINMMRKGFGGHPYGKSEPVARERKEGRIGDYLPDYPE